ncbi:AAA family ATPase [Flindersiella endophytica]
MDELLDDGSLLGVRLAGSDNETAWRAYDQMWVKLIAIVRRAGHPVMFLCPTPSPDGFEPFRAFEPPVHWARLECSDRVRRERLRRRGWPQEQVDDFLSDPGHARIRALIPTEFRTDDTDPAALATEVLNWITETDSS